MIGVFTTRKYDRAGRLADVLVAHNSFTLVGMDWMWRSMSGQAEGHLGEAQIVVGDGTRGFSFEDTGLAGEATASAPLAAPPLIRRVQDSDSVEIVLTATFGEREGVFDWGERGVVTSDGVLLDRAVSDQGRKPLGVVWTVEAALRLDG